MIRRGALCSVAIINVTVRKRTRAYQLPAVEGFSIQSSHCSGTCLQILEDDERCSTRLVCASSYYANHLSVAREERVERASQFWRRDNRHCIYQNQHLRRSNSRKGTAILPSFLMEISRFCRNSDVLGGMLVIALP